MTNKELLETAKEFIKNEQFEKAENILEKLLKIDPNNDEFIFYSGVNNIKYNPEKAFTLFEQVLSTYPESSPALTNLLHLSTKLKNYNRVIIILDKLITLEKGNILDLIYHKANILALMGKTMMSLLSLYYYVDNSSLREDANLFLNHQVSEDIAGLKFKLRGNTINTDTPLIPNSSKLYSIKMKEYSYPLPAQLFGNESYLIEFGKMMGFSIKEIIEKEPDYISWCILNLDNFCVSEDVIQMIKIKGIDVSTFEKINLFKLKVLEFGGKEENFEPEGIIDGEFLIFENDNEDSRDSIHFMSSDFIKLYRKWYLIENKDRNKPFDQAQLDELLNAIKFQLRFIIKEIEKVELYAFRYKFQFPYINDKQKRVEQIEVEVLVIGNTIECLNIPGCIVEGKDRKMAFDNLVLAIVETFNARVKYGFGFLNRVFPLKLSYNESSVRFDELVLNFKRSGWNIEYKGFYNTILLKTNSKVSFCIPNKEIISEKLHNAYVRLMTLMDARQYYELYGNE